MKHRISIRRSHAGLRLLGSMLMGVSLSLFAVPARTAIAASITVTTTVDELTNNSQCSLREAIRSANLDQAIGGCPAGNGADTIRLPAGTYMLTLAGPPEDAALSGDLDITADLKLQGAAQTTTIIEYTLDGWAVQIPNSANVQIADVTIRRGGIGNVGTLALNRVAVSDSEWGGIGNHGTLTLTDSTVSGHDAGGIWSDGGLTLIRSTIRNNLHTGGIENQGTLTIEDSTISGNGESGIRHRGTGLMSITHSLITGNGADWGGGIENAGRAIITDSIITGNQARDGGGGIRNTGALTIINTRLTENYAGSGGAIYHFESGQLSITDSTIDGNTANYSGGGLLSYGSVEMEGTTLSNNVAFSSAGGIRNFGTLTMTRSSLNDNDGNYWSGGIENSGTATIQSSVMLRNAADEGGGGIRNLATGTVRIDDSTISDNSIGGISNEGDLTLTNSTLSGNSADNGAGLNNMGTARLSSVTVTKNVAGVGGGGVQASSGTVEIGNTIIAGNVIGLGHGPDIAGTVVSRGYNLIGNPAGVTMTGDTTGNLLNADARLGPLEDNGGPMPTHALLRDSPAIDAGDPTVPGSGATACEATDQRGVTRPQDGNADGMARCDIGAVEVERPSSAQGLTGAYYDSRDFTRLKRTRLDSTISFDWGYGSPDEALESSTFSVRWTGQVVPRFNERYTFFTQNDDGVRLWINNQLLIDDWRDHGLSEHQGTISLQAGVPVNIRLDYYEHHGQAAVKLLWASPSQPKQSIPASQLRPAPGLIGAYYQNGDFTSLVLSRQDATIAFDWGYGSPDAAIEDATFSVRWTGQVIPRYSERTTFYTQNDDGVRLWVNGQLLIDDWRDHGLSEHQGTISLQAGVPVNIWLDYYEHHGQAAVKLLWSSPLQPKQIISASQLLPPQ